MQQKKIKWGIIGLGNIADKFAQDLKLSKKAELHGVASRTESKAKTFKEKHKAVKYFGSYKELTEDPEIDVVYIATPHTFHYSNTMLCLDNNKSVLCEKPMGMNAQEVKKMQKKAVSKNLFLMEGMWTRFIPATEKLIELIRDNYAGEIISLHADFGFKAEFNPNSRIFNKNLGGSSLLDIGIYPIYLSQLLLGMPTKTEAVARMAKTGVDSYCAILFEHENSAKSVLESTTEADTPTEAIIYGTKKTIKLHSRFHHSKTISIIENSKVIETINIDYTGNGYYHEIEEVNSALLNRNIESKKLPHHTSLQLVTTLDKVMSKIDLKE
ncbi:Gfo/Idh/MocA family oxidoreductase [Marinilabiliaceae bacterium ANBcel2]|nr:Gfo/Idh/MocA family oxidoreductase [Marinilabiliaceae bacterium ANBcel2]